MRKAMATCEASTKPQQQDDSSNSRKRKHLGLLKERLRKAQEKKLAAELSSKASSSLADANGNVSNGDNDSNDSGNASNAATATGKAQDTGSSRTGQLEALRKAKAALLGAKENRERALRRLESRRSPTSMGASDAATSAFPERRRIPPISALGVDIIIGNIGQSGTDDLVRIRNPLDVMSSTHHDYASRMYGMDRVSMGMKHTPIIQPLHAASFNTDPESMQQDTFDPMLPLQQQPTVTAQERAGSAVASATQMTPQSSTDARTEAAVEVEVNADTPIPTNSRNGNNNSRTNSNTLSKSSEVSALQKRKEQMRARMEIVHWKHTVRKQEKLLAKVDAKVSQNELQGKECEQNLQNTLHASLEADRSIGVLEAQLQMVERLRQQTSVKLLRTRNRLHGITRGSDGGGNGGGGEE